MPYTKNGFYRKGTKLVLNPKYSGDHTLQRAWRAYYGVVYTVLKSFFDNGESHVTVEFVVNGIISTETIPDCFFIEQPKGI